MEKDKLGIKPEFFERLVSCGWFCNCGDKTFDQFEVIIEENQEHGIACLNSLVYGNARLEKRNNLSFDMREVPGGWNEVVKEVERSGYIGKVNKRIKSGLKKKGIPGEEVIAVIRSSVSDLFRANYFSEYYTDTFYEQMFQIYLSGHLPCGYEHGKFRVY